MDTWEGAGVASCWTLGRGGSGSSFLDTWGEAGIVDLHVGHLGGGLDSGSSCWTLGREVGREAGVVDLHVVHFKGRLQ